MRNFLILIVSAVKICKQSRQAALTSGLGVPQIPGLRPWAHRSPDFWAMAPNKNSWRRFIYAKTTFHTLCFSHFHTSYFPPPAINFVPHFPAAFYVLHFQRPACIMHIINEELVQQSTEKLKKGKRSTTWLMLYCCSFSSA